MTNHPAPVVDPSDLVPRWFLYLTAALNGAAILVVEILGAKMLSPYFGTSHFVWTAQIAVTLVSLAIGYWLGGLVVDRSPRLGWLYGAVLVAAAYLVVTLPFVKAVSFACLKLDLALGSMLAALFLFLVPLTLLATTGPYLARLIVRATTDVGRTVGRLSAVSTFGSVGGTLLVSYALLPALPNSTTMLLTAAVLVAEVLVYFSFTRKRDLRLGAAALLVLAGTGVMLAVERTSDRFAGMKELHRENSNFGMLQVVENDQGTRRFFLNDYLIQNSFDPTNGKSASLFTHMLHDLALSYGGELERVLCIGMGIGIVPALFAEEGLEVDVAEINPDIIPLAEEYFDFDPDKMNLFLGDGRNFLQTAETASYDAVILDAFLGDSSPSHLMSLEAFQQIRRVLREDGVLVINSFGSFTSGKDFMMGSLDKTLKAAFSEVVIHASGNGNVFFVAGNSLQMKRRPDYQNAHPAVVSEMMAAVAGIKRMNPETGMVLTDDYNPVEFFDAANREDFRRRLISGFLN